MPRYRNALPQDEDNAMMLTDGGLETTLIYRDGIDLPHFAACELLRTENGMRRLLDYYSENALVAVKAGIAFSIDSPTWRANPDWTENSAIRALNSTRSTGPASTWPKKCVAATKTMHRQW